MKTFFVGIKGVIVHDGKVLILRTNPEHENRGDRWDIPGGRINDNETIEQALNRELVEELPNIKNIQIGEILGAYRVQKDIKGSKSLVLIYYLVSAEFDGNPEISQEHLEWVWADEQAIMRLARDGAQNAALKALKLL